MPVSFEAIRKMALALDQDEEGSWGSALNLCGSLFRWMGGGNVGVDKPCNNSPHYKNQCADKTHDNFSRMHVLADVV